MIPRQFEDGLSSLVRAETRREDPRVRETLHRFHDREQRRARFARAVSSALRQPACRARELKGRSGPATLFRRHHQRLRNHAHQPAFLERRFLRAGPARNDHGAVCGPVPPALFLYHFSFYKSLLSLTVFLPLASSMQCSNICSHSKEKP